MTTITDVARLAGVSIATVSHVINGTRPVREETRQRVLAAIAASGYSQHAVARALRRARTDTVALVVTDTGLSVFAEMVRGVELEARRAGYTLFLANSQDDEERETQTLVALRERRVDGILLAPVGEPDPVRLRSVGGETPFVLLDRLGVPTVDQVGVENVEAVSRLVRHLAWRGHRAVAYVSVGHAAPTLLERRAGYDEAVAACGLISDPSLAVSLSDARGTRAALRHLLRRRVAPTALVTASQESTVATLRALGELGCSVPDDIAVATFDEFPFAGLFEPQLTSVCQPAFAIGREAMRLLLRRRDRPDAPQRTVRLDAAIAHRTSCGCKPGAVVDWATGAVTADTEDRR